MTASIHPTALVDPRAKIANGVDIGPYCIVGPEVEIGANTKLHSMVKISGKTIIGEDNQFFHCANIGDRAQDYKEPSPSAVTQIGHGNTFREYTTVHRPAKTDLTIIGDKGMFMASSHIAHDCIVGNNVILANSVALAGHVEVDDYAYISGLIGVHQFCKIGQFAMVGNNSKINQDIPPFTMASGVPAVAVGINAVGMKRAGFDPNARALVKRIFKILFTDHHTVARAKELIQLEANNLAAEGKDITPVKMFLDFFTRSKRGILSSKYDEDFKGEI